MTTGPIRVALVEDHAVFAEAMRVSLDTEGIETVIVPVRSAGAYHGELVQSVIRTRAGVVLLDLDLGSAGNGSDLIAPLTLAGLRVVVLTASDDRVQWGECLAKGARTVASKLAPLDSIVDVIRQVDQGVAVLSRSEREMLVRLWRERHSDDDEHRRLLAHLTPREAHVLRELARGNRVREVAQEDFVSEATVRTQVKSILAKLGVHSQLAAVAIVRDLGWTPPDDDLRSDHGRRPGPDHRSEEPGPNGA